MPKPGRENAKYRGFLSQPSISAAIAELADGQHAVFGLDQLRELGLSARAVQDRAATGRLHRIHKTVYSLVPKALLKREGLYMAAVLACGPGAVLSHRSAAVLHHLRDWGHTRIEVTVPRRSARTHPGVAVHRSTTLTAKDITVIDGIPVTSLHRTLFDVAEVVDQRELEREFDQAQIVKGLDLNKINDQLARNPTRAAASKIRKVLTEHYIGSTPTENDLEEDFLAITRGLGLPDPRVQFWIDPGDGGRMIRADFAWPELRIVVETDGRRTHGTDQAFESDRRRDQRLVAAGWRVIRTTWRQIKFRPHELRETLLKLLGPASPNGTAKPAAAGVPDRARPRTQRAGESTS
jgi:predicted transcriptional regulator of viral defense system